MNSLVQRQRHSHTAHLFFYADFVCVNSNIKLSSRRNIFQLLADTSLYKMSSYACDLSTYQTEYFVIQLINCKYYDRTFSFSLILPQNRQTDNFVLTSRDDRHTASRCRYVTPVFIVLPPSGTIFGKIEVDLNVCFDFLYYLKKNLAIYYKRKNVFLWKMPAVFSRILTKTEFFDTLFWTFPIQCSMKFLPTGTELLHADGQN